jgi:hypothetical protein
MPRLSEHDRWSFIDSHWTTVVLVAMTLLILSFAAVGSPSCMTKREARAHYPRAHLYWHGSAHCWDNRRGGTRRQKRDRDPLFARNEVTVAGPVVPGLDVFQRFLPWEQRIVGSFP